MEKNGLLEGAPESPTILRSVEPGSEARDMYVWARDDHSGELTNVSVSITTNAVLNSGGHQHDNNRNGVAPGTLSAGTQNGKTIQISVKGAGAFYFTPPAASGDHVLTATCTTSVVPSTCSMAPGPNKVWVGIKGLQPLMDLANYDLIGWREIHPDNHYLTSEAVTKVMNLAYQYHSVSFPFSPVLQLNDASLERGGVFDIATTTRDTTGWYSAPHSEHRRGTVIDIQANGSATAIPRKNQAEFERIMSEVMGMTWVPESLNKSNGHYHVRTLGGTTE